MTIQQLLLSILLVPVSLIGLAQDQSFARDTTALPSPAVKVRKLLVTGNKKTKDYIIFREAVIREGDSIPAAMLYEKIEECRRNVYNTTLFNEVIVTPQLISAREMDLLIAVKERWYVFPVPLFRPVDRNLAEWLKTNDGDLSRVNYGVKLIHYNLTGRRDQLRIFLLNGYTRNLSFSYTAPYSNSALTEGYTVSAGYSQNREITYKTDYDGKQRFFSRELNPNSAGAFVRENWFVSLGYTIRKGIYNRHLFTLSYNYQHVNDSIVTSAYNPAYFNRGIRSGVGYPDLIYQFQHTDVSNIIYPLYGNSYRIALQKRGWGLTGGVNMFAVEAEFNLFKKLGKEWYWDIHTAGKLKLPFVQPFINQQALGYGENYLRGLELYVTDGSAFTMLRNTFRKKVLAFNLPFPFKSKSHTRIPFTFYAKAYNDLGYAYTPRIFDTYLNNRLLYTGGLGIDIVTLYDVYLRVEYSVNQFGQKGLFLHTKAGF
jgi:hypothetical protein